MTAERSPLLHGTLDLLVLRTLSRETLHGWAISKRIRQLSEGVLDVNQGSLYPALYRLEDQGLIEAEWGVSDRGRRAKFYRLTRAGRGRLGEESEAWTRFVDAVHQVLDGPQAEADA